MSNYIDIMAAQSVRRSIDNDFLKANWWGYIRIVENNRILISNVSPQDFFMEPFYKVLYLNFMVNAVSVKVISSQYKI